VVAGDKMEPLAGVLFVLRPACDPRRFVIIPRSHAGGAGSQQWRGKKRDWPDLNDLDNHS
jgi:hypothetical protein